MAGVLIGSLIATSQNKTATSGDVNSCVQIGGVTGTTLIPVRFGAVTRFPLPSPTRSPNAITAAKDGSVWFGEQALPGVAHLYPNGTLHEYRWPYDYPSSPSCSGRSDIWGVAVWNGTVWASDNANSQLVGLNPATGSFEAVRLKDGSFPYTLLDGPDGNLWFTQLSSPAVIGRVSPGSHQVQYFALPDGKNASSAYLTFSNATVGYALTISPLNGTSKLFLFDPSSSPPTFREIEGANSLQAPTSIALGEGGIWLTQHSASAMAKYDLQTEKWEAFPMSRVNYTLTTLAYFDVANSSTVWFNEHYGNKLGIICCNGTKLTEYSFSDPPARNGSAIDNALTIALASSRVWFTGWTGNCVGFVNASYRPPFSVSTNVGALQLKPGGEANVTLRIVGSYTSPLTLQFSDSESFSSVPKDIRMSANVTTLNSLQGEENVGVTVTAAKTLAPGDYKLLLTVNGGLVIQSGYVTLHLLAASP